jgi:hypothetical protein
MTEPATELMGKIAFDAYAEAVGGKTYDGKPIPKWDDLSINIQQAWNKAAWAVMDEVNRRLAKK